MHPGRDEVVEEADVEPAKLGVARDDGRRQLAVVAHERHLPRPADEGNERARLRGLRGLVEEHGREGELPEHLAASAAAGGAHDLRAPERGHLRVVEGLAVAAVRLPGCLGLQHVRQEVGADRLRPADADHRHPGGREPADEVVHRDVRVACGEHRALPRPQPERDQADRRVRLSSAGGSLDEGEALRDAGEEGVPLGGVEVLLAVHLARGAPDGKGRRPARRRGAHLWHGRRLRVALVGRCAAEPGADDAPERRVHGGLALSSRAAVFQHGPQGVELPGEGDLVGEAEDVDADAAEPLHGLERGRAHHLDCELREDAEDLRLALLVGRRAAAVGAPAGVAVQGPRVRLGGGPLQKDRVALDDVAVPREGVLGVPSPVEHELPALGGSRRLEAARRVARALERVHPDHARLLQRLGRLLGKLHDAQPEEVRVVGELRRVPRGLHKRQRHVHEPEELCPFCPVGCLREGRRQLLR
mmetsp:Transcript_25610/g.60923  ORF Transcript_25610/g.60923 Transcript_25610/m.60923 type:complete len:474 (+) Transcript_25610:1217-2638(+)